MVDGVALQFSQVIELLSHTGCTARKTLTLSLPLTHTNTHIYTSVDRNTHTPTHTLHSTYQHHFYQKDQGQELSEVDENLRRCRHREHIHSVDSSPEWPHTRQLPRFLLQVSWHPSASFEQQNKRSAPRSVEATPDSHTSGDGSNGYSCFYSWNIYIFQGVYSFGWWCNKRLLFTLFLAENVLSFLHGNPFNLHKKSFKYISAPGKKLADVKDYNYYSLFSHQLFRLIFLGTVKYSYKST